MVTQIGIFSKEIRRFDEKLRKEELILKNNFLDFLKKEIHWEKFRYRIDKIMKRKSSEASVGRPPYDMIFMFKILVLQALYNLSDEQTEFQIKDRLSFMHFLDLQVGDNVPDARTIWLFRDKLREAKAVEKLFSIFDEQLAERGFKASGGQIIDASFVIAPSQHNKKEENELIKEGKIPEEWSEKKKAHKDIDARWTKKNNVSYFGYKNHINIDNKYKFIRHYSVSAANIHDSQELEIILRNGSNKKEQQLLGNDNIYADSAYRGEKQEACITKRKLISKVHKRAYRNTPLSEAEKLENREKSRVRARVEHVFGHMKNSMHGDFIRTIGIERARVKIGLINLAYNISRLFSLTKQPNLATA